MRRLLTPVAALAVGAVAVGATGTAVAATGGTFILGKKNVATTTTTLVNTAGIPLALTAPSGKPALSVSNGVRIPRLNADEVDGLHASALQRRVAGTCPAGQAARSVSLAGALGCLAVAGPVTHVVNVSAGATPVASGTALLAAIAGISDASDTIRYVVVVGPGSYDVGTAGVQVPAGVDIVGSGQSATTISGTGDTCGGTPPADGTVQLAPGTTLRDLTVSASATGCAWAMGVTADASGTTATVQDVTVATEGSGGAIAVGISALSGSTVTVQGSRVTAIGDGPFTESARADDGGILTVLGSTLTAIGATSNYAIGVNTGGAARADDAGLTGLLYNDGSPGAGIACVNSYDSTFAAVTC